MTVGTGYVEAIDTQSLAFLGPIVALETLGDDLSWSPRPSATG